MDFKHTNMPMNSAKGFSLIEVMISVFVLAIGLLGLAALQLTALGYTTDSQSRSLVMQQINEFADRMRANPVGMKNGNYNGLAVTTSTPSCSAGCTPAQIAQRDFNLWNADNSSLFTSGAGIVTQISNNIYDITIRWDSHRTGATGTGCSSDYNTDLTCVKMRVSV